MSTPRWTLSDFPDQTGRRWLITGATNGLGLATARAVAGAGGTLVLPARNRALASALNDELGGRHEIVDLDLADLASVRAAGAAITSGVDVLVNNAGIIGRRREETVDGFEKVLGVNQLGPFAFTNLVLPRVRERIVVVSSNIHPGGRIDLADPHARHRRWTIQRAYADSKLANMLWGLALERRLRGTGIGVQLVHPGWVMSNLQSAIGNAPMTRAYNVAAKPFAQSAEQSALCVLFAATMDLPACSYVGPDGRMHLHGHPSLLGRSAAASDPRLAEDVWQLSASETGTDLPA
ncbi:MAG: SDR family NAD(P)-dependent oxidoreductase [Propionibacteriaceae bacterium]|nr:SDR family NAD(P)-dependent oxidoreductase [Propionibacteriaceae bacterium]